MTVEGHGKDSDRIVFTSQEQFVRFLFAVDELKNSFIVEV